MSDIFYSSVDLKLQQELNARAKAGVDRTTDSLDFMLGKVANVLLNAFSDAEYKVPIANSSLGGRNVITGEYLANGPSGFLSDRVYQYKESAIINGQITTIADEKRTNTSKKIPPFITSADINIGDHSMGLLNSSTINITIPNPGRDLNFIESVYLRPGRHVQVIFEYPISAVLTRNENKTGRLDDKNKLAVQTSKNPDVGTLHQVQINGLIKSFTITYQTNLSVDVTLNIIGNSNTYSDLKLVLNTDQKIKDTTVKSATTAATESKQTFYEGLNTEVENYRKTIIAADNAKTKLGYSIRPATSAGDTNKYAVVWGEPFKGLGDQVYITLNWVIDFINTNVIQKMANDQTNTTPNPNAKIHFNDTITTSNYYPYLVSANPMLAFFPDKDTRTYDTDKVWYSTLNFDDLKFKEEVNAQLIYRPSRIFINMKQIQDIMSTLQQNDTFKVSDFLQELSSICSSISGRAIDLQLVTHPETIDDLLWYDSKKILSLNKVQPYSIPMGVGSPNTVVRDFKFTGQLPSNASSLAYVLNQDPSQIAESDIAPFVSYMYTANSVERPMPTVETVNSIVTQEQLNKINDNYRSAHVKFLTEYNAAKKSFIDNITNTEQINKLTTAAEKYIQYPTDNIVNTNSTAAPVIPFDTEFTIDGVNGFRYGDVLMFDLLPTRYKQNVVFNVINVSHTIGTDGIWTTTVRCITRPKIG